MDYQWYISWCGRLKVRLNQLSLEGRLTRVQFAEQMKISRGTLGKWLSSDRKTKHLQDFDRACRLLGMHPIELFFHIRPSTVELATKINQLLPEVQTSFLGFLRFSEEQSRLSSTAIEPYPQKEHRRSERWKTGPSAVRIPSKLKRSLS